MKHKVNKPRRSVHFCFMNSISLFSSRYSHLPVRRYQPLSTPGLSGGLSMPVNDSEGSITNGNSSHSALCVSEPRYRTRVSCLVCVCVMWSLLRRRLSLSIVEIIRSLKQTATTCVLKLSPEIVGFIVTGPEVGPEGVQIWS